MTISKSPKRHTFQEENYIKRCEEKGEEPNEDYLNMYKTWRQQDDENMNNPVWQKNNLEYDLRSTDWILEKVRASESYAQNLYAAMCNMRWCNIKGNDPSVTMDILKNELWSCSWRSAGGIVADMREQGDYIDWYCSGIRNENWSADEDDFKRNELNYVAEGNIAEEIAEDLKKLGWVPSEWPDDE